MNRVMNWWYGDMLTHSPDFVEMMPSYVAYAKKRPRIQFLHFRAGRPGGFWGLKRDRLTHRAFGVHFYGALGRLGFGFAVWPLWAIRFEGYLFPPATPSEPSEAE
jgi:hypothetical protein